MYKMMLTREILLFLPQPLAYQFVHASTFLFSAPLQKIILKNWLYFSNLWELNAMQNIPMLLLV